MADKGKTPDINCDKRQREEDTEGKEQHRCIERKRPDKYLQIVEIDTCSACPLANLAKPKSCQDKFGDWRDELISVEEVSRDGPLNVNPSEENKGYTQPCPYRWDETCRVTGLSVTPEICRRCDQDTAAEMATLPKKLANYANAVRRWIVAGRPVRSDEEVERIFNEHCKPCELYDKEAHACTKCGCNVAAERAPLGGLVNKLKMATEDCPLGRW